MKLIETLRTFSEQCLAKLQDGDVRSKSLLSLIVVTIIAASIWFGGPYLCWEDYFPLEQSKQRIYIIATLYLLWLLKYLLLDLDTPAPSQYTDPALRKATAVLQKRFYGALRFLHKTKIARQGKNIRLNQLPWFLMIGPQSAGKTTLLAKSNVNFILQRQFQGQSEADIKPSEHCDWWVTRDASVIDVPARYFNEISRATKSPALWEFYLRLVKDQRGKDAFHGVIITLPLPEIMQQADSKRYQTMLKNIFHRLHEFQQHFQEKLPLYLLVTKCDKLPGFTEFFAEAGNDEVAQAWGILLPQASGNTKLKDLFTSRFNALIKKLNQQLLWRMHQERNPMARPYIKDFPLQVERLKEFIIDFINKYTKEEFNFYVKGFYLTSALQEKSEEETPVIEDPASNAEKSVQLFKEPTPNSRAFFIRQFLTQALSNPDALAAAKVGPGIWKRRAAYIASLMLISVVTYVLGKDFNVGIQHTRSVQADFVKYELSVKQFNNPAEHLQKTVELMNDLRQSANEARLKFNLASLMSFYSQKSKQKAFMVYKQALRDVYLMELKNYLGEFIKTPINKNTDSVYGVLKAYLMLGDDSRMDKDYLKMTLRSIFPNNLSEKDINEAFYHLDLAISYSQKPLTLDATLIEQTRRYLLSLQGVPLAYIILKNINNNYVASPINLGVSNDKKNGFISKENDNAIPAMFTVHGFGSAFSQDTEIAASEALTGNWVLGDSITISRTPEEIKKLTEKLRENYVKDYIRTWESILADIRLSKTEDLQQTDAIIVHLISDNSPLLQLLQTLHENTYFEPISNASEKLQNLGLLVDKSNAPENLLYQILIGLQSLHQYIQPAIVPENQNKKAFEIVSKRMATQDANDAVTQVRLIAQKSPEPIKSWLEKITDDTWRYLMKDATKYIDVSWREEVSRVYQADIANRYPFSTKDDKEVNMDKFIKFFGNPGVVVSFYNYYLKPFIDTSGSDWQLRELDNLKLPISNDTMLQLQQGLKIHQAFFPNDDARPSVQFTIQPHQFGKNIKSVKLNINNKQILEGGIKSKAPVALEWPIFSKKKMTSLQLALEGGQAVTRDFSGDWGWFKLMGQSFDTAVSSKQIVLNFSQSSTPAKYVIITGKTFNPFMSMNLNHFHLPEQLLKA